MYVKILATEEKSKFVVFSYILFVRCCQIEKLRIFISIISILSKNIKLNQKFLLTMHNMHHLNSTNKKQTLFYILLYYSVWPKLMQAEKPLLSGCSGNPDAKRLYDDLLSNYNKLVRPVVNVTDALTVKIKLKLSQLIDVVNHRPRLLLRFTSRLPHPYRDAHAEIISTKYKSRRPRIGLRITNTQCSRVDFEVCAGVVILFLLWLYLNEPLEYFHCLFFFYSDEFYYSFLPRIS